jgi:hypothetical protein
MEKERCRLRFVLAFAAFMIGASIASAAHAQEHPDTDAQVSGLSGSSDQARKDPFQAIQRNQAVVLTGTFSPRSTSYVLSRLIEWSDKTGRRDLRVHLVRISGSDEDLRWLGTVLAALGDVYDGVDFEYDTRCGEVCDAIMDPAAVSKPGNAGLDTQIAELRAEIAMRLKQQDEIRLMRDARALIDEIDSYAELSGRK